MFLVALCGVCGMMTVVVVRVVIFFGGGGGSRKSNYIVYRCTLSDMVLIIGNVGGQARQGKERMELINF